MRRECLRLDSRVENGCGDASTAAVISSKYASPMPRNFHETKTGSDPIQAVLNSPGDSVLAVIAGVEGPSYRPLGAMMAILADLTRVGTLSSGCIEKDIALHASSVLETNTPRLLRYGQGSPFADIELPCGGGLDILLMPRPDRDALETIKNRQSLRIECGLSIDIISGAMSIHDPGATERADNQLNVRFDPGLRFLVFGKGPEAASFAALVQSLGYSILLLSPDAETLWAGEAVGCETRHMSTNAFPSDLMVDHRTAIVLFFHDHEREPSILKSALDTSAFYIGSQGSQRARETRHAAMLEMGVSEAELLRLHGPVGLIPSARDPGTLAVSVLAEVLAKSKQEA